MILQEPATKPSMGVYEAWINGFFGKGVVIAILDDGMDIDHSDLKANYVNICQIFTSRKLNF